MLANLGRCIIYLRKDGLGSGENTEIIVEVMCLSFGTNFCIIGMNESKLVK
jgi:hypothetical protein